jgi:hypothetical protein
LSPNSYIQVHFNNVDYGTESNGATTSTGKNVVHGEGVLLCATTDCTGDDNDSTTTTSTTTTPATGGDNDNTTTTTRRPEENTTTSTTTITPVRQFALLFHSYLSSFLSHGFVLSIELLRSRQRQRILQPLLLLKVAPPPQQQQQRPRYG